MRAIFSSECSNGPRTSSLSPLVAPAPAPAPGVCALALRLRAWVADEQSSEAPAFAGPSCEERRRRARMIAADTDEVGAGAPAFVGVRAVVDTRRALKSARRRE